MTVKFKTIERAKAEKAKAVGHTPGPWRAHYDVPTAAIPGHIVKKDDDTGLPIASIWVGGGTHGKPLMRANAALIAAAPELLEACRGALEVINKCVPVEKRVPVPGISRMLRAAIAKAEGVA